MRQIPSYTDSRLLGKCVFCAGAPATTRDHCPSRVLLDEPFPSNLPVVPACEPCNASFSRDEEYFACLVCCALAGSTDPEMMRREKVRQILLKKPALRRRLEDALTERDGVSTFAVERSRVEAVVLKLARGHVFHEFGETRADDPLQVGCHQLDSLDESALDAFESSFESVSCAWPEVGSRSMQRLLVVGDEIFHDCWVDVQDDNYRYRVSPEGGTDVRLVIGEYLACQVIWAG